MPELFNMATVGVFRLAVTGRLFSGDVDPDSCRFPRQTNGMLDLRAELCAEHELFPNAADRLGLSEWFKSGHGWNGCRTLPRELSLSKDGQYRLRQEPAPE